MNFSDANFFSEKCGSKRRAIYMFFFLQIAAIFMWISYRWKLETTIYFSFFPNLLKIKFILINVIKSLLKQRLAITAAIAWLYEWEAYQITELAASRSLLVIRMMIRNLKEIKNLHLVFK